MVKINNKVTKRTDVTYLPARVGYAFGMNTY